jgi:hypothetical protein
LLEQFLCSSLGPSISFKSDSVKELNVNIVTSFGH